MNTTSEKWRQYGVMVKNTTETVGGMLRIEANDGKQIIGEPVAFCYTQEQADRVVNAINCHADLLQACKVALDAMKEQQMANAKRGEPVLVCIGMAKQQCEAAITKATTL